MEQQLNTTSESACALGGVFGHTDVLLARWMAESLAVSFLINARWRYSFKQQLSTTRERHSSPAIIGSLN